MIPTAPDQRDLKLEILLGNLLRYGLLIAATVVAIGGVLYLIRHGLQIPEYHVFRKETVSLRTLGGIISGVVQFKATAIIQFGFLLLIATPVARVVFSAVAFARERDMMYVLVTLVVLAALMIGLSGI